MSFFGDLSAEGRDALHREFETEGTTRERRIDILTLMREGANEAEMGTRCPRCKNYPFFAPYGEALIEGHVYSGYGLREIRITCYCEYCFDLIMNDYKEEDNE